MGLSSLFKNKITMTNFKPTWELTQILIQLEEAGMPSCNSCIFEKGYKKFSWFEEEYASLIFLNKRIIIMSENEKLDYSSLPEVIEKLKQLLRTTK